MKHPLRLFILTMSLFFLLHAVPSTDELKRAVEKNPELLNTPQAQAEMKKRGITDEDVQNKLNESKKHTGEETNVAQGFVQNDILENNESNTANELNFSKEADTSKDTAKRLNPFAFQTNEELRLELKKKKPLLSTKKLSRYSEKFYTNENIIDSSSFPTPSEYILSSGDELSIYIYGDRDTEHNLIINAQGSIEIPYIGPVKVGGLAFKDAKQHLEKVLKNHFKMSEFTININKYSTIQVTLIGDVKHPGLYNLSSFSTLKELFTASKGFSKTSSVREIQIQRDGKIIENADFYDLLFQGKTFSSTLLKHGDTVIVKRAQTLASVDGFINNSAIFELTNNETLYDLIEYAGGLKADGSKLNIKLKRFSQNEKIESFDLTLAQAKKFLVKNGDSVVIYPLDDSYKANVNIYGNVIRAGSYPIAQASTLNELLQNAVSQGRKNFFLPETFFEYALIKRYSDSLHYETKTFNINDILENKEHITILPHDEIYIFSHNDIFSSKYITTKGDILLNPGKLRYYPGMTLADAVYASGVDSVVEDRIKVTTFNTPDLMPKTHFYSLKKEGNIELSAYDEIEVLDYYDTHFLEPVSISGEVINPTVAYYEKGMSVASLIKIAGGLSQKAYRSTIEIVRYYVDKDETRRREILKIDTKEQNYADIALEPYDEVIIFKIPQWSESKTVELRGEVKFPGKYTIQTGERLSSIIERAGGFTERAFIEGAVFTRESIRKKQVDQYNRSLAEIKRQLAIYNAMPANARRAPTSAQGTDKLNEVIEEAKKYEPVGRISIKIDDNLEKLASSEYDLALEDGDVLAVPSHIDTVSIFGEVFNPSSFVYRSANDTDDYINLASGYTRAADENRAYVIHADGTSKPARSGWWIFSSSVEIVRGDTIVVPIYIQEYNQLELWDNVAKIMSSFAITAATLNTLGVIN